MIHLLPLRTFLHVYSHPPSRMTNTSDAIIPTPLPPLRNFFPTSGLPSWDSTPFDLIPNTIDNTLLNNFCFTLDPLVYFHTFDSFSLTSSKIINISPAIYLPADDLLRLQDSSPGDTRVGLSTNDGGLPIVIDSGASYSVTLLRHDFLPDSFTTKTGSIQQLSDKTSVKGVGPVH